MMNPHIFTFEHLQRIQSMTTMMGCTPYESFAPYFWLNSNLQDAPEFTRTIVEYLYQREMIFFSSVNDHGIASPKETEYLLQGLKSTDPDDLASCLEYWVAPECIATNKLKDLCEKYEMQYGDNVFKLYFLQDLLGKKLDNYHLAI